MSHYGEQSARATLTACEVCKRKVQLPHSVTASTDPHPDDVAVDQLAITLKAQLKACRAKIDRRGNQGVYAQRLLKLLRDNIDDATRMMRDMLS